jgi:hypothetical protein
MDTQLSHLDQYKMLREEIMQHMREANRTEFWGVTAAGVVYAWLIVHKGALPLAAWFISPCVILFCGLRVLSITLRMRSVAEYLRRIEKIAFGHESELPGWERYLDKYVGHFKFLSPAFNAIIFWTLMVIASAVASWFLSR